MPRSTVRVAQQVSVENDAGADAGADRNVRESPRHAASPSPLRECGGIYVNLDSYRPADRISQSRADVHAFEKGQIDRGPHDARFRIDDARQSDSRRAARRYRRFSDLSGETGDLAEKRVVIVGGRACVKRLDRSRAVDYRCPAMAAADVDSQRRLE